MVGQSRCSRLHRATDTFGGVPIFAVSLGGNSQPSPTTASARPPAILVAGRPRIIANKAWYRRALVVCATLACGVSAGMIGTSETALAACAVAAAPNTVDCATTTTTDNTNTNATLTTSSNREQLFNAGGAVSFTTATVASGATVSGFGLAITNAQAPAGTAGDISVSNSGTITLTSGVPSAAGPSSALNVTASGGNITYTGTGAVNVGSQNTTAAAFVFC